MTHNGNATSDGDTGWAYSDINHWWSRKAQGKALTVKQNPRGGYDWLVAGTPWYGHAESLEDAMAKADAYLTREGGYTAVVPALGTRCWGCGKLLDGRKNVWLRGGVYHEGCEPKGDDNA